MLYSENVNNHVGHGRQQSAFPQLEIRINIYSKTTGHLNPAGMTNRKVNMMMTCNITVITELLRNYRTHATFSEAWETDLFAL